MQRMLVRTQGGGAVGMGHLMRCLSLANAIRKAPGNPFDDILFMVNHLSQPFVNDWGFPSIGSEGFSPKEEELIGSLAPHTILFDGYAAGNAYLAMLKRLCDRLWIFDDNNDQYRSDHVDGLVNGNLHAEGLEYSLTLPEAQKLLGPHYLVMKPEYWEKDSIALAHKVDGIMITTGGADTRDLTIRFLQALKSISLKKRVVIGPSFSAVQVEAIKEAICDQDLLIFHPQSLKPFIQSSSVILTAGGSTVYEVLRMRRIPLVVTTADNQRLISKALVDRGIPSLGNYNMLNTNAVRNKVLDLLENLNRYQEMCCSLHDAFDGQGAIRVARSISNP